ncbi:gamma-glutamyl-gamma-aminobutyrate hydrolase family protein [Actinoplanes sp. NPDC051861]|uniref:gamma-glutamyl-gamma-aminobutyrate hydrolase family protein n=1 Tax=Actinoplanes sp. NPDC051861 TaxID=3155170 RepID=UPI00342C04CE
MGRPLIAVPARFSESASALRYRAEVAAAALVEAVFAAGGEPLVVHPAGVEVRERLAFADGILLPGGGDLAPRWSGQAVHETLYDVSESQDAFDLAVARVAIGEGWPLLAVCRGVQVVNVALGGDLVQDMTEVLGRDHRHVRHEIGVGAPLAGVLGADRLKISCYHHQSIGRLGAGLEVTARAEDGTIEAVALSGGVGWFQGVQWHPEDTAAGDPVQARLFSAFVEAAAQRSVGTSGS